MTDQETSKRLERHRRDILAALQEGPKLNRELVDITWRFSATIHQLREQGHQIESRHIRGPDWQFIYRGKEEVVRATKSIQEAYYQTPHWKQVRDERMKFDGYKCCQCKSDSELHVHHWEYELFNEDLRHLMTLCRLCHDHLHKLAGVAINFPRYVTTEVKSRILSRESTCRHDETKIVREWMRDGRIKVSCQCGKFFGYCEPEDGSLLLF